jgi:hypothetical protein
MLKPYYFCLLADCVGLTKLHARVADAATEGRWTSWSGSEAAMGALLSTARRKYVASSTHGKRVW